MTTCLSGVHCNTNMNANEWSTWNTALVLISKTCKQGLADYWRFNLQQYVRSVMSPVPFILCVTVSPQENQWKIINYLQKLCSGPLWVIPVLELWSSLSTVFAVPFKTPWFIDSSKSSTSIGILSASKPLSIHVPLETNPLLVDELLDPMYGCVGLTSGLERGLCAAGRTLLSHPLTISTNCRHFKRKSRFGFLSKSPGYNVCVVSIASPILPARPNFCIPGMKESTLTVLNLGASN